RDMRMLTVRKMAMPATLTVIILGSASMAGLPPMLGFVSKESLFDAFLSAQLPGILPWILAGLATLAAIGTFGYSGRLVLGAMGKYRSPRNWINTPRGTSANQQTVHEARISFWDTQQLTLHFPWFLGVSPLS